MKKKKLADRISIVEDVMNPICSAPVVRGEVVCSPPTMKGKVVCSAPRMEEEKLADRISIVEDVVNLVCSAPKIMIPSMKNFELNKKRDP